jgi:hypothetical protein
MEINNSHSIEFDLFKIKDVNVFDILKNKVESKFREHNIKYDIKLIDDSEMVGGSNSTYPYSHFEDTIDSIIGKKQENKTEREDMFKFLFSTPEQKDSTSSVDKPSNFFDFFTKEKKNEQNTSGNKFNLLNMDLFKTNKTEVKEPEKIPTEEVKEPDTTPTEEAKEVEKIPSEEVKEPETTPTEEVKEPDTTPSKEVKEPETTLTEEQIVESDDTESIKDFIQAQSKFIKVIITIYYDDKNEKILPTIIGIKKWTFMP